MFQTTLQLTRRRDLAAIRRMAQRPRRTPGAIALWLHKRYIIEGVPYFPTLAEVVEFCNMFGNLHCAEKFDAGAKSDDGGTHADVDAAAAR